MRTPEAAMAEILERVPVPEARELVALAEACGRVLADDAVSDVDLPPFEKSAMDGFAVRCADFRSATSQSGSGTTLALIGESRAGAPFLGEVRPGECIEIYTGAEVPQSCDAVVMVEKSVRDGSRVRLDDAPRTRQHICARGEDLESGETVLRRGRRLSAIDLSVLAAVGCQPVPVFAKPRVALFTTGDELVQAHVTPARGEIREGNTFYLAARMHAEGASVWNHGIIADEEAVLERAFQSALESSDVLVTTGGVSMGKYDLVGAVLERCGVEPVFHKIAIKPGKPLWFGMRGRVPVFALPGNPVSCLIGFEVFVRPALSKMSGAGEEEWRERMRIGRWMGDAPRENPRQQNLPVRVAQAADGVDELTPIPWTSSADITGLTRADALAVVGAGSTIAKGERVAFRPLRGAW